MSGSKNKLTKRKTLLYTTMGKLTPQTLPWVRRAFESWKKYNFDVVVFGEEEHEDLCKEYNINLDLKYEKNEFNLPLVKSLFLNAKRYDYDVYCYLNSDIEFQSSPQWIIDGIEDDNFLLVGQRMNYDKDGKTSLHNPGGIDYFFYTKDFWEVEKDMPELAIACGRFDHYLLGYALKNGNGKVIDLTQGWTPLHPNYSREGDQSGNFHYLYSIGNLKRAYQIYRNNIHYGRSRYHGQTDYTSYFLDEEGNILQRFNKKKNEFDEIL